MEEEVHDAEYLSQFEMYWHEISMLLLYVQMTHCEEPTNG
jgi:hypothetical protein